MPQIFASTGMLELHRMKAHHTNLENASDDGEQQGMGQEIDDDSNENRHQGKHLSDARAFRHAGEDSQNDEARQEGKDGAPEKSSSTVACGRPGTREIAMAVERARHEKRRQAQHDEECEYRSGE